MSKNLLSSKTPLWCIPNGHGRLWTPHVFDTEAEAQAYIDKAWADYDLPGAKHRPVLAEVRLTATPHEPPASRPPTPTPQNDGGNDGA